jgi:hypothetical protein
LTPEEIQQIATIEAQHPFQPREKVHW